jgi:hypothetical protein
MLRARLARTVRWIAGRVIEQDLLAADAGDDVVAKVSSFLAECRDGGGKVGDFNAEVVPSSGVGRRAVGKAWPPPGSPPGRTRDLFDVLGE